MNFACQVGGIPPLEEADALRILPPRDLEALSEAMLYAVLAAVECARSSGEKVDLLDDYQSRPVQWRAGAFIGGGITDLRTVFDRVVPVLAEAERAEPGRGTLPIGGDAVTQVMMSGLSASVGRFLGLGGQVSTNSAACSTGTEAVFEGMKQILLGYADAMYVGAAEGSHYAVWAGFDAMRDVLCTRYNDTPEKASRPLSAGACGMVPSSGAAVLKLEALESALARKAPILCEILSGCCNAGGQRDGGSMTFPNPEGMRRCIRAVIEEAGIPPREISLINGHLTSTKADPLEVSGWREALGLPPERFPWIQSTKSMVGHALAAAGALETVAVVDQLAQGYVHPSINADPIHPEIAELSGRIPRACVRQELRYAIKASFGFGDVNACLLFKRWEAPS